MKPSDNPFKPGTKEFNDWNKEVLIVHQRLDGATWNAAVKAADNRLAQLKARYPVGVILDADIDKLVNGGPEDDDNLVVDLTPYRKHLGRLGRINAKFQELEQYVIINGMLAYMPQIDDTPDWVTDKQLYSILFKASCRNVEEVKQQHGYLFYAVTQPLSMAMAQAVAIPSNLSAGQVRVQYELWRR